MGSKGLEVTVTLFFIFDNLNWTSEFFFYILYQNYFF